jgi:hypothetical protein
MSTAVQEVFQGYAQELGRHAWFLIHATASAVESEACLTRFKALAQALIHAYPCGRCRKNVQAHCRKLLDCIDSIGLVAGKPANFQAVVWAARLHACVSLRVHEAQVGGDSDSWLSPESLSTALTVESSSDDAVYHMLEKA